MPEWLRASIEIGLLWIGFYAVLRFMQGTRGEGIVKGYAVLVLVVFTALFVITQGLELRRLAYLLNNLLALSFVVLIVIFQPEMRNGLIRLGQRSFMRRLFIHRASVVAEVITAVARMSASKTGALIAFEREVGLGSYMERGVTIDGEVSQALISTIFKHGSPLHDGAIVVRGGRLAAAGCLFPLTDNTDVAGSLGTRHRAAIGLSDETDALVIAVSEEDGSISLAEHSRITRHIPVEDLGRMLDERLSRPGGTVR